jgi:DNA primase
VAEWAAEVWGIPPRCWKRPASCCPAIAAAPPYDRFKGRLMFPIRDEQGRVVGFSGRILDQSSPAKYVNSPETPLFKKSRLLYGLDRARQHMTERRAVICEGQIDVIRCHLAGIRTAVAPQGTALTEAHALLLKRYADEVVLVFDSDTAGQNAALRGAETLLQAGLDGTRRLLPAGEDPDTLMRGKGPGRFRQACRCRRSRSPRSRSRMLQQRGELDTPAGQLRAARAVLETIAHAPSAIQREQYLREAAATAEHQRRRLASGHDAPDPPPGRARDAGERAPGPAAGTSAARGRPDRADHRAPGGARHGHQYVPPEAITDPDCRRIIETIMAQPEPDQINLVGAGRRRRKPAAGWPPVCR